MDERDGNGSAQEDQVRHGAAGALRQRPYDLANPGVESRNVLEDFKRIYGEDPVEGVELVSINRPFW